MKGKLKGLMAGVILFFAMTMTVNANPSGSEDLPSRMIMTPTVGLNVRNAPGLHGQITGSISPGEKVVAVSNQEGWFMIDYKDQAMFAYGDYLSYVSEEDGSYNQQHAALYGGTTNPATELTVSQTPAENPANFEVLDLMMKATAPVNMRLAPYGTIVNVLQEGSDIHVIGNLTDVGWYKCETNGQTVYIHDDYLTPEFPQTMKATVALNVRPTPSTSHTPVGLLQPGDKVKVSGEENGWFKYTYEPTGQICYSKAEYMSAVK